MSDIITIKGSVTTTGSTDAATGSTTTEPMFGELIDIYLNFHASAPAGTDTTIAYAATATKSPFSGNLASSTDVPARGNILVVSNSATDALFAPRQKPVDNANAAITNAFDRFHLDGPVTVSLAQCDPLTDALVFYIRYKTL